MHEVYICRGKSQLAAFAVVKVELLNDDGSSRMRSKYGNYPFYVVRETPSGLVLLGSIRLASRDTPEPQRRLGRSAVASQGLRSRFPLSSESITARMSQCRRRSIRRSRAYT